jgi:NADPH-dependent 2,4-dienoyl-CoA reductase/sulfur reductase-like enzyme
MNVDKALPRAFSRRTVIAAGAGIAALGKHAFAGAQTGPGSTPSVGVVGAGVVGLNVARVFAEQGFKVTV